MKGHSPYNGQDGATHKSPPPLAEGAEHGLPITHTPDGRRSPAIQSKVSCLWRYSGLLRGEHLTWIAESSMSLPL